MLDLSNFKKHVTQSQRMAFSIPLKSSSNQFIIGAVKSDGNFSSFLVTVEKEAYVDANAIFQEGGFNAYYTFYNKKLIFGMKIENSTVTEFRDDPKLAALKCREMVDVYDCAARNIAAMRTVAWLECMATIIICLGIEMADCILDGCANLE